MEAKINIATILKDKPQGTKLYSSACGKCELKEADDKSFKVSFYSSKFGFMNGGEGTFDKNGNLYDDGECVVFPSKEMRDWSKFAWKKGDVLVGVGQRVFFEKFIDENYTKFQGKYSLSTYEDRTLVIDRSYYTSNFSKINNSGNVEDYFEDLEEKLGGKLNRETLEIEKPEFKDGDIVYAESNAYHYPSIHILNINGDTKRYYARLVNNGRYDEAIDYDIPAFDDDDPNRLRLATEAEKQKLFEALAKEGKAWDAEKKMIVDLKQKDELKPFDKVLVRNTDTEEWFPGFFEKFDSTWNNPYHIMNRRSMTDFAFKQCIPYEGNESLLGTTKDVEG
nr:MAG TPA: hypothetical protein [Caudoviricetes sp.]